MTGSSSSPLSGGKRYRYRRYRCTVEHNQTGVCDASTHFPAERVEKAVYGVMVRDVLKPNVLAGLLEGVETDDAERARVQREVARLEVDRDKTTRALSQLMDAIERGGEVLALVNRVKQRQQDELRIATELLRARRRLDNLEKRDVSPELLTEFCEQAQTVLAHEETRAVRRVLSAVVSRIVVRPDGAGQIWYRVPEVAFESPHIEAADIDGAQDFKW
jgi:hypothetical protein